MVELINWNENPNGAILGKYSRLAQAWCTKYRYERLTFSHLETNKKNDVVVVYADGPMSKKLELKFGEFKEYEREMGGIKLADKWFEIKKYFDTADNDYYCIGIEALNGKSFSEYYKTESVESLIGILFSKKLKIFDKLDPQKCTYFETGAEHRNIFDIYKFNNAKIIEGLKKIDRKKEGQTLLDWWDEQRSISKRIGYIKVIHGNLHSGNIIIENGSPELINFGDTAWGHVFADLASLECSIKYDLLPQDSNYVLTDYAQLEQLLDVWFDHPDQEKSASARVMKAYQAIKIIRNAARQMAVQLELSEEQFEFAYCTALLAEGLLYAASPYVYSDKEPSIQDKVREQALINAQDLKERLVELTYDAILWRVAYAFLRLDQLPVGGWSRSLPGWLRAIQLKSGEFPSSGAFEGYRSKGGVHITCEAFIQYKNFLNRCLNLDFSKGRNEKNESLFIKLLNIEQTNGVAGRTQKFLQKRIGTGGGVDVIGQGDLTGLKNQIHHTLLVTVALLYYELSKGKYNAAVTELKETFGFSLNYLKQFREQDRDRIFGTYVAADLLKYLIKTDFFTLPTGFAKEDFVNELEQTSNDILQYLVTSPDFPGNYFHPHSSYQRADFLMQMSFLLADDASDLSAKLDPISFKVINNFNEMLEEMRLTHGLISFIADDSIGDFGNSARLATYLRSKQIQSLLRATSTPERLIEKSNILKRRLQQSIIDFDRSPQNFYFTHGVSFSYYLNLIKHNPTIAEVEQLDEFLNLLLDSMVTEKGIIELLKMVFSCEFELPGKTEEFVKEINIEEKKKDVNRLLVSIKNLLISKLESGAYYFPFRKQREQWESIKEESLKSTLEFFNSDLGIRNAEANSNNKDFREFLYKRLGMYVCNFPEKSYVLDIGCGKGDFAAFFLEHGMNVHIGDNSPNMRALADNTIRNRFSDSELNGRFKSEDFDLVEFTHFHSFTRIKNRLGIQNNYYKMIFADGVLFHVPQKNIKGIFESFYNLLDDDGILFVNFKINDHTLISFDGRFFEFYPDYSVPLHLLGIAGFTLKELIITEKSTTMYGKPLFTQWAHYFCIKKGQGEGQN